MKRTCTLLPLSTAPISCTACSDTCGNGLSRRQGAVDAMVGEMDSIVIAEDGLRTGLIGQASGINRSHRTSGALLTQKIPEKIAHFLIENTP